MKKLLQSWLKDLADNFSKQELQYGAVHKAKLILQVENCVTEEIHLHNLKYEAREGGNNKVNNN